MATLVPHTVAVMLLINIAISPVYTSPAPSSDRALTEGKEHMENLAGSISQDTSMAAVTTVNATFLNVSI